MIAYGCWVTAQELTELYEDGKPLPLRSLSPSPYDKNAADATSKERAMAMDNPTNLLREPRG